MRANFFKFLIFIGIIYFSFIHTSESIFSENLTIVKDESTFNQIPTIQIDAFDYLENTKNNPATRLILVRHGQSLSNKEKSIAGRTLQTELSEEGVKQAEIVAQKLLSSNIHIEGVFSSPTLRTLKTAETIQKIIGLSLPINEDSLLHEKWYGPYEGATEKEYAPIKAKEEREISMLPTFADKFSYKAHPEIESMEEIYSRNLKFIKNLAENEHYKNKNILVVTHNGNMKSSFMADAALCGFDVEYRSFDLNNCSIIVLELNSFGEFEIVATSSLKFRKK